VCCNFVDHSWLAVSVLLLHSSSLSGAAFAAGSVRWRKKRIAGWALSHKC
jgi:hypothetical protein